MKTYLITLSTLTLLWTAEANAQPATPPETRTTPVGVADARVAFNEDGLGGQPIPEILKTHLPPLQFNGGLWVRRVAPNSRAAILGIQPDDLLLSVNRAPVDTSTQLHHAERVTVLRNGQLHVLPPPAQYPFPITPRAGQDSWGTTGSTVRASAFAHDGQSVAVSRSGNMVSVQFHDTRLSPQPIRYHGTDTEIRAQIDSSDFPDATKQAVRQAIAR